MEEEKKGGDEGGKGSFWRGNIDGAIKNETGEDLLTNRAHRGNKTNYMLLGRRGKASERGGGQLRGGYKKRTALWGGEDSKVKHTNQGNLRDLREERDKSRFRKRKSLKGK